MRTASHVLHNLGSTVLALGDIALSLSPWVPGRGPLKVDEVTLPWLNRELGTRVPGAALEKLERTGGSTGTTDRTQLGLQWNAAGIAAGLPASIFVKCTPLSAKNRAMVGPLKMAVNEVRFYRTARADLDDIAPNAYATNLASGARFLLLLEDLTQRGCQTFSLADDVGLDHLQGIVRTLATLHAAYWDSPRFGGDLAWVAVEHRRPAHGLLTHLHRRCRRRFIDGREAAPMAVQALARALSDCENQVVALRERGPLTLVHGDCHLGNTYRLADGRSGLLDWQVVHRGQGLREIAYFLGAGAPVELRRRHERELIALYLDTLRARGVKSAPTAKAAWNGYRFWMSYAWDAVQLTRTWPGLQEQNAMDASWSRVNAAVADLDVASAVLSESAT